MTLIDIAKVQRGNPLEVVEHMATTHLWSFERACEDELIVVVRGKCADYQGSFTWMRYLEALHLACRKQQSRGPASGSDDQQADVGRTFRSLAYGWTSN